MLRDASGRFFFACFAVFFVCICYVRLIENVFVFSDGRLPRGRRSDSSRFGSARWLQVAHNFAVLQVTTHFTYTSDRLLMKLLNKAFVDWHSRRSAVFECGSTHRYQGSVRGKKINFPKAEMINNLRCVVGNHPIIQLPLFFLSSPFLCLCLALLSPQYTI